MRIVAQNHLYAAAFRGFGMAINVFDLFRTGIGPIRAAGADMHDNSHSSLAVSSIECQGDRHEPL
ncbi:hypothetical protein D9M68_402090 [compost metagenome]